MSVCFEFDARAWELGEARYAVAVVASLLEHPWRLAPPGQTAREGEATVWVGAPAGAPPEAAAVIRVEEWEPWEPGGLEAPRFEGTPLLCPAGSDLSVTSPRELPRVWLRSIAYQLTREEERRDRRRDQWECFSGFYARAQALGVLDRPLVSLQAGQLAGRLAAWFASRRRTPAALPRWKGGARFAVALTHDVDWIRLYSWADALRLLRRAKGPRSYALRAGLAQAARALLRGRRHRDPYWNFDGWAAEEARRGFRSTFFFCPPAPAERHEYDATYRPADPVVFGGRRVALLDMMRELEARGFEVGLHGSYLSHRSGAELARQRRQLEEATGAPLAGLRQHFLRFDVEATWPAQEEAGFLYDCTLGFNEALGFRAGVAAPFHPWDPRRGRAGELLELPLTAMDGVLFRTLKLGSAEAAQRVREHLQQVEQAGGLAVLLWHPNAADAEHFPGWWECYRAVLDYLAGRPAWVASGREIADWWRERERGVGYAG
jgi:peptidoglycan/xylan/chitin deacetylase (PgdA/CDA1 family)